MKILLLLSLLFLAAFVACGSDNEEKVEPSSFLNRLDQLDHNTPSMLVLPKASAPLFDRQRSGPAIQKRVSGCPARHCL